MPGSGKHGHKPGDQRREKGDVFGMTPEHTFGKADQVIHPSGDLHGGDSGDNRHNDFDDVEGDRARFNLKHEGQDEDAQATGETDADSPEPGSQINRQQDNNEFCTKHICLPCFINKLILGCCNLVNQ